MRLHIPYFKQQHEAHCGAAALRMLFAREGDSVDEESIAKAANVSLTHGIERGALLRVARSFGYVCRSKYATLHELQKSIEQKKSVIVNYIMPKLDEGHYAVVSGWTASNILLHDPWFGEYFVLSQKEFAKRWMGYKVANKNRGWMMEVSRRRV